MGACDTIKYFFVLKTIVAVHCVRMYLPPSEEQYTHAMHSPGSWQLAIDAFLSIRLPRYSAIMEV